MSKLSYYQSFSSRVDELRRQLIALVQGRRIAGARLAAYGAAAKGATLLNFLGFAPGTIEYVVDRNPHKVGKYIPGVRLPIRPADDLLIDAPDYVLILAWNFANEIVQQNRDYIKHGGRFIVPLPETVII